MTANGKRGLASYFVDPIFKLNGNQLELTVGSKTLKLDIEAKELDLIKFFQRSAYNPSISYAINAEEVSAYKLFTPKQQFDAMAKENPVLKQFEERFGLDFDV